MNSGYDVEPMLEPLPEIIVEPGGESDEMANTRAMLKTALADLRNARQNESILLKAMTQIINVAGPGPCERVGCPGCHYEMQEALNIAADAIKRTQENSR